MEVYGTGTDIVGLSVEQFRQYLVKNFALWPGGNVGQQVFMGTSFLY